MQLRYLALLASCCLLKSSLGEGVDFEPLFSSFPQLQGQIRAPHRPPLAGGQNFTYCCLLALNDYIRNCLLNTTGIAGDDSHPNQDCSVTKTYISVDESVFSPGAQFPCGAAWNGNLAGAPLVQVSYHYGSTHCNGWQISQTAKTSQWLQPLVGFILPSVIFSLNVPRRNRLYVSDKLFPTTFNLLKTPLFALLAGIVVIADTIIWLSLIFGAAAPLLLSGVHEAWLDKKILDFVYRQTQSGNVPAELQAQLLSAVLAGNLDTDLAFLHAMSLSDPLEEIRTRKTVEEKRTKKSVEERKTMETVEESSVQTPPPEGQRLLPSDLSALEAVKMRLKAILASQYSFGSTMGAPIVFYNASFIYAIYEIKSALGDDDTAQALAFGMWWMAIPHIAIVSGCLLGGNNPNTLEGISPHTEDRLVRRRTIDNIRIVKHFKDFFIQPTYESKYYPAWSWDRSISKREWFVLLCQNSYEQYHDNQAIIKDMKEVESILKMGTAAWISITAFSFLLLFIPCLLGFLTAYWTPRIGLSCRSLTFLVYMSCQTILLFLQLYRLTYGDPLWKRIQKVNTEACIEPEALKLLVLSGVSTEPGELERQFLSGVSTGPEDLERQSPSGVSTGPADPERQDSSGVSTSQCQCSDSRFQRTSPKPTGSRLPKLFYVLLAVALGVSLFSAIGGALLQIMGVYRNCLCQYSTKDWVGNGKNRLMFIVSTNTAEQIKQASTHWTKVGWAGIAFLSATCSFGWWYQRWLRRYFRKIVDRLIETP